MAGLNQKPLTTVQKVGRVFLFVGAAVFLVGIAPFLVLLLLGNPYRRSNPEPGGPRYPLFGLLSRVRCFDAHWLVLQISDF